MAPKKEDRTVQATPLSAPASSPAHRRRCERATVAKSVTLVVETDRSRIAHSAFAVDLSELGIRIRSGVDLRPGQLVAIIPNEGGAHAVPSRVVWVAEEGSEAGEAGIAFLEPLTLEA